LVDFLKTRDVTALFTNLGHGSAETTTTQMEISSLMDTWLLLYNRESNGEHNRQLYVLKSRGMAHSNQIREFVLSSEGIKLREAYIGPEGVLTGSARLAQETKEKAAQLVRQQEISRRSREADRRRREITTQIAVLQAQLEEDEILSRQAIERENQLAADQLAMASTRQATPSAKLSS
jgi:circadian clock protein KaiC